MARYYCFLFVVAAFTGGIVLSGCSAGRKTAAASHSSRPATTEPALQERYARQLAVTDKDIRNIALYRFIDTWYGTPYKYGGSSRKGVDCSGFSEALYKTVYNRVIPRTSQQQYDAGKKLKKHKLEEGDLVFFHEGGRKITHVGVYLMNDYFVHASTGKGVIISYMEDDYWKEHFAGAARPE